MERSFFHFVTIHAFDRLMDTFLIAVCAGIPCSAEIITSGNINTLCYDIVSGKKENKMFKCFFVISSIKVE